MTITYTMFIIKAFVCEIDDFVREEGRKK